MIIWSFECETRRKQKIVDGKKSIEEQSEELTPFEKDSEMNDFSYLMLNNIVVNMHIIP